MNNDPPMLREDSLKGKVILITGGGTGLGKAMTWKFSQLGAKTAICGRRSQVVEETAAEIEDATGNPVLPIECDIRDVHQVEQMFDRLFERFDIVNGLVNNAAGNFISPTERLSPKAFKVIIDIVLMGTVHCTLELGKRLIEKEEKGTFLNITTTYASTGSGYVVPSATAKAGVLALTRSLASEWGKYGIRSNAVSPGLFPTKGAWDRLFPKEVQEKFDLEGRVPLGRTGDHNELTDLISFLMSEHSSFVNGEEITIDGGEWLKGAGQFNQMDNIPKEMWSEIERMVRERNKKDQNG